MSSSSDKNPLHHTQKIKKRLEETVTHLRQDIDKVDEPQLAAMFETAAEVLTGLIKAFDDYEKKNEAAWRQSAEADCLVPTPLIARSRNGKSGRNRKTQPSERRFTCSGHGGLDGAFRHCCLAGETPAFRETA